MDEPRCIIAAVDLTIDAICSAPPARLRLGEPWFRHAAMAAAPLENNPDISDWRDPMGSVAKPARGTASRRVAAWHG